MIYAALLPLGEAPLLASVRIGKWPKCKSFSGARRRSQRAGEEFSLINYLTLGAGAAASDHFRFELHCSARGCIFDIIRRLHHHFYTIRVALKRN